PQSRHPLSRRSKSTSRLCMTLDAADRPFLASSYAASQPFLLCGVIPFPALATASERGNLPLWEHLDKALFRINVCSAPVAPETINPPLRAALFDPLLYGKLGEPRKLSPFQLNGLHLGNREPILLPLWPSETLIKRLWM